MFTLMSSITPRAFFSRTTLRAANLQSCLAAKGFSSPCAGLHFCLLLNFTRLLSVHSLLSRPFWTAALHYSASTDSFNLVSSAVLVSFQHPCTDHLLLLILLLITSNWRGRYAVRSLTLSEMKLSDWEPPLESYFFGKIIVMLYCYKGPQYSNKAKPG